MCAEETSESSDILRRRLLREQFRNGRLDAATSKAEILEELCDKLNFDPDSAGALHKQLYREKLMSVVTEKKISGATPGLPLHETKAAAISNGLKASSLSPYCR